MNPTVILVHGAFAESSSWNDVVTKVTGDGHRVIAFANPLRSLAGDASALMAVTQRPITEAALSEPPGTIRCGSRCRAGSSSGTRTGASRSPPTGMAERASAKRTVEIAGASRVVGVSHAEETAGMILEAARPRSAAEV